MIKKPEILIVDDQSAVTEFLEVLMAEFGNISIAHSGPEALSIAVNSSFDLIISDINMYPMSGIEFGFRLRKIQPTTPIIFFSGELNGEVTYREDLESIGNSSFIEKNYESLKKLMTDLILRLEG